MFGLGDLFQWERFVTPTVIKVFYWLAVVIYVLLGFAGVVSSLTTMAYNPFVGLIFLIAIMLGAGMGIIMSRIAADCADSGRARLSLRSDRAPRVPCLTRHVCNGLCLGAVSRGAMSRGAMSYAPCFVDGPR